MGIEFFHIIKMLITRSFSIIKLAKNNWLFYIRHDNRARAFNEALFMTW